MTAEPVVLFAGGGSGGHLSPALAVAESLARSDRSARSLFACSGRSIDRTILEEAGVRFEALDARPLSLRPMALARFGVGLARSVSQARRLIRREGVTHVVTMGGFVAAPAVIAARLSGVPVTLVNLDAPPGLANRLMSQICPQVLTAIAVPGHRRYAGRVVGMPIRSSARAPADPPACRGRLKLVPNRRLLLVTGASQGSRSINAFLEAFAAANGRLLGGWQVFHLCGDTDASTLKAAYTAAGVTASVEPFSHRMGLCWGSADLAVSRAGASSVAEAWANSVPTLFLPYPHHRDQHQVHNARPMVEAGGALVETDLIDPGANLRGGAGRALARLLMDERGRRRMRQRLVERPAPDGAAAIVETLLAARPRIDRNDDARASDDVRGACTRGHGPGDGGATRIDRGARLAQ